MLWLQEDVLQRRHAPKRARKRKAAEMSSQREEAAQTLADEAQKLAEELQAPLEEALAMLIDDRIEPPAPNDDKEEAIEGALFQYSTIEVYVAAVMELWQAQTSAGSNRNPNPRTDAVSALIAQRKLDRAKIARQAYEDRGAHGYSGGYTAQELANMQGVLLQDQNDLVSTSLFMLIGTPDLSLFRASAHGSIFWQGTTLCCVARVAGSSVLQIYHLLSCLNTKAHSPVRPCSSSYKKAKRTRWVERSSWARYATRILFSALTELSRNTFSGVSMSAAKHLLHFGLGGLGMT